MRPLLPAALGLAFLIGVVACSAPANTQAQSQASAQPAATDSASPDDTSSPDGGSNSSDGPGWGEVGLPDGCSSAQQVYETKDGTMYLICSGKLYKYGS